MICHHIETLSAALRRQQKNSLHPCTACTLHSRIWGAENVFLSRVCYCSLKVIYFLINERGKLESREGRSERGRKPKAIRFVGDLTVLLGREAHAWRPNTSGWGGKMQSLRPAWTTVRSCFKQNEIKQTMSNNTVLVTDFIKCLVSPPRQKQTSKPPLSSQPTGGFGVITKYRKRTTFKLFMFSVSSVNCGSWAPTLEVWVLTTASHPSASIPTVGWAFGGARL